MHPRPGSTWTWWAALAGFALVAVHTAIRATSGFGWVAVFQGLAVAPWLVLPLVPLALHLTSRAVATDRPVRRLVVLGSVAFLLSAFTLDVSDSWGECFLGACRDPGVTEPWWGGVPLVGATPLLSLALSWVALGLLLAAALRTWRLHRRGPAGLPPPPGADRAPARSGQTQSVPGMPSGMAMTDPGPMA
jgi:hypothetical protein